MWSDVRLALRSLRRSPTFTVTAVLTLALGIGGSTAIFSLVDAVLLRPLPYRDPNRLVRIWESKPAEGKDRFEVSAGTFVDWRQRAQAFDDFALFYEDANRTVVGAPNGSLQVRDAAVTTNLFSLLGVAPLLGGGFTTGSNATWSSGSAASSDAGASLHEVVLSFDLWRQAFGSDPAIVGKTIRIEGRASNVVAGVMPRGFSFPAKTELWSAEDVSRVGLGRRAARFYGALGRLRRTATIDAARADLEAIARQLAQEYPSTNAGWTVTLAPLQNALVGRYRAGLVMLLGAVTFVLLVGCANVANLLLARGASRRREIAVRVALGATRGRIVRQLLTESLVLAVAGGVAGWLLAYTSLPLLIRISGDTVPRLAGARLSATALAFCAAISIATALIVGLLPALDASHVDFQAAVQADGERSTPAAGRSRVQQWVVAVELAVSLVLLVGAVLLIQSFVRLRRVDLGFNPEQVVSVDVRQPLFAVTTADRWFRMAERSRALLARTQSLPGVIAAATTSDVPLAGTAMSALVTIRDGSPVLDPNDRRLVMYHVVSPGYFATMGMRLVQGRPFTDADASDMARVADLRQAAARDGAVILNETTARTLWPAGNALGRFLSTNYDPRPTPRRQVVGIVADARSDSLRGAAPLEVYVPYLENPSFAMTLLVRTALPPDRIVPALRAEIRAVDQELSTANVRMLTDVLDDSIGSSRASTVIVGAFAAAALLLSAIGVYGVLAFGVTRRRREIGIRMALGAGAGDISRLFLAQAMKAIAIGVAAGTAGSLALTRLMSGLLFGVTPTDPASFAAAASLLVVVALTASYLPVRYALRTDPADALRQ